MKVYLDTNPSLAEWYRSAARSVSGLEWVDEREVADGVVVDQVQNLDVGKKVLFVGEMSDLTDESVLGVDGIEEWVQSPGSRFDPSIQSVYESLRSGQLGELGLLRSHRWIGGGSSERQRSEDLLSQVGLALWFFGAPPETVYGVSGANGGVMQVHLGFSKNGMAILDFGWDLPQGRDYNSLHLIGDRGAAYADDHRNVSLLYAGDHPRALRVDNEMAEVVAQLRAWIQAGDEGQLISLSEIRTTQEVVDAVLRSAALGQASRSESGRFVEGEG